MGTTSKASSARFGITVLGLASSRDNQHFLEISESEFVDLEKIVASLYRALRIEERFDMFLENYLEYERELLNLTLGRMLFQGREWEWASYSAEMQVVNRRLANLLTTSCLYTDQVKGDIAHIYGKQSEKYFMVCKYFSDASSASLAYRAMTELRNHIQHRGFLICGLGYHTVLGSDGISRGETTIIPSLDIDELLNDDTRGSRGILRELSRVVGAKPNVTPLVRQYVASVANLHSALRELLIGDVERWEASLSSVRRNAEEAFGVIPELPTLRIVQDIGRKRLKIVRINDCAGMRRCALERKNQNLAHIPDTYVSGRS
jgi:hypothetical protein